MSQSQYVATMGDGQPSHPVVQNVGNPYATSLLMMPGFHQSPSNSSVPPVQPPTKGTLGLRGGYGPLDGKAQFHQASPSSIQGPPTIRTTDPGYQVLRQDLQMAPCPMQSVPVSPQDVNNPVRMSIQPSFPPFPLSFPQTITPSMAPSLLPPPPPPPKVPPTFPQTIPPSMASTVHSLPTHPPTVPKTATSSNSNTSQNTSSIMLISSERIPSWVEILSLLAEFSCKFSADPSEHFVLHSFRILEEDPTALSYHVELVGKESASRLCNALEGEVYPFGQILISVIDTTVVAAPSVSCAPYPPQPTTNSSGPQLSDVEIKSEQIGIPYQIWGLYLRDHFTQMKDIAKKLSNQCRMTFLRDDQNKNYFIGVKVTRKYGNRVIEEMKKQIPAYKHSFPLQRNPNNEISIEAVSAPVMREYFLRNALYYEVAANVIHSTGFRKDKFLEFEKLIHALNEGRTLYSLLKLPEAVISFFIEKERGSWMTDSCRFYNYNCDVTRPFDQFSSLVVSAPNLDTLRSLLMHLNNLEKDFIQLPHPADNSVKGFSHPNLMIEKCGHRLLVCGRRKDVEQFHFETLSFSVPPQKFPFLCLVKEQIFQCDQGIRVQLFEKTSSIEIRGVKDSVHAIKAGIDVFLASLDEMSISLHLPQDDQLLPKVESLLSKTLQVISTSTVLNARLPFDISTSPNSRQKIFLQSSPSSFAFQFNQKVLSFSISLFSSGTRSKNPTPVPDEPPQQRRRQQQEQQLSIKKKGNGNDDDDDDYDEDDEDEDEDDDDDDFNDENSMTENATSLAPCWTLTIVGEPSLLSELRNNEDFGFFRRDAPGLSPTILQKPKKSKKNKKSVDVSQVCDQLSQLHLDPPSFIYGFDRSSVDRTEIRIRDYLAGSQEVSLPLLIDDSVLQLALSSSKAQALALVELIKMDKCKLEIQHRKLFTIIGKKSNAEKALKNSSEYVCKLKNDLDSSEVCMTLSSGKFGVWNEMKNSADFQSLKGVHTCDFYTKPVQRSSEIIRQVDFPSGTKFDIRFGDITKDSEVQAITNAANSSLAHDGGVAKSISLAAGPQLSKECRSWLKDHGNTLPVTKAMSTSAGDLHFQRVIHAVGPMYHLHHDDKALSDLTATFVSVFMEANRLQLTSLALPLIGSGIFNNPTAICLRALFDALEEIEFCEKKQDSKTPLSLRHIRLALVSEAQLRESCDSIDEFFSAYPIIKHNPFDDSKMGDVLVSSSNEKKSHKFFYDDSSSGHSGKFSPYDDDVNSVLASKYLKDPQGSFPLEIKGSQSTKGTTYLIDFRHLVQINRASGFERAIQVRNERPQEECNSAHNMVSSSRSNRFRLKPTEEEEEHASYTKGTHLHLLEETLFQIAVRAFPEDLQAAKHAFDLAVNDACVSDNVGFLPQISEDDAKTLITSLSSLFVDVVKVPTMSNDPPTHSSPSFSVTIFGSERMVSSAKNCLLEAQHALLAEVSPPPPPIGGISYPADWDLSLQPEKDSHAVLVPLDLGSLEAKPILEGFNKTMSAAHVHRIERIQNKKLFDLFSFRTQRAQSDNEKPPRIEVLYHGSRSTNPKDIYDSSEGFLMNFSQEGMWGRGIYFAVNASYSNDYHSMLSEDVPSLLSPTHLRNSSQASLLLARSSTKKQMLVCDVLVGETIELRPDRNLKIPPLRPHSNTCHFDSVQGFTNGSHVYIVYDHGLAYPRYILTYS